MKKIKDLPKYVIGAIIGTILVSTISVFAIEGVKAVIKSEEVSYDNKKSHGSYQDVQGSIDELYKRSGIMKDKWTDPILNGADPVLKDPLIPVTIDDDGTVHYANLYTKWYEYETKRWANAVILADSEKGNYKTGDKIPESAIESYFVWIPRYKYKIWDLGNYEKAYAFSDLKNSADTVESDLASRRFNNSSRLIDIIFGDTAKIEKMEESQAQLNKYYTHPAFTLGEKELNGIWVGKFEVTGDVNRVTVKPGESSLTNQTVGTFWNTLFNYQRQLDSHMMKNTQWGAVAYLSHSIYGIGTEVNINNNSDYKTGYSATAYTDQTSYPGTDGTGDDITQPWNTPTGYLASTTGNITGIYDMNGGAHENMAAYIDGCGVTSVGIGSGLTDGDLTNYAKYFDKYSASSTLTSYDKRILGDATGEMGPFYNYFETNIFQSNHSSWYADESNFISSPEPWFHRGCNYICGVLGGQFYFGRRSGGPNTSVSSRLVLAL